MTTAILALDQGTTSSRAILFDLNGDILDSESEEFPVLEPRPGWVEQDPIDILRSQRECAQRLISRFPGEIAAVGLTNQRETTIVWDRKSGKSIYPAIVWQDRRTSERCNELQSSKLRIQEKTGLVLDPYFSATKLEWVLNHVPDARRRAKNGELCFGTVDTFIAWHLSGGKIFATDFSNASRTMLFNIVTGRWDDELLEIFNIPRAMLPEVLESSAKFGVINIGGRELTLNGVLGDQQAALFGQLCHQPGEIKCTYGTGSFLVLNTGSKIHSSNAGLIGTIAWRVNGVTTYALEGSVFVAGSAVQWLRDGLGLIKRSSDVEEVARSVSDSGGVIFVPALTGLGAPHWDSTARGALFGITRGTNAGHIARATLEGIAFQVTEVIQAMRSDTALPIHELRVDGGACKNSLLMQLQSDTAGLTVFRPRCLESTALGVALLAGLGAGIWRELSDLRNLNPAVSQFKPELLTGSRDKQLRRWIETVARVKQWES